MKSLTPVEFNELYLLHVYLLMKVWKYNEALAELELRKDQIVDKQQFLEYKAECLCKLDRQEEAKEIW